MLNVIKVLTDLQAQSALEQWLHLQLLWPQSALLVAVDNVLAALWLLDCEVCR